MNNHFATHDKTFNCSIPNLASSCRVAQSILSIHSIIPCPQSLAGTDGAFVLGLVHVHWILTMSSFSSTDSGVLVLLQMVLQLGRSAKKCLNLHHAWKELSIFETNHKMVSVDTNLMYRVRSGICVYKC